MPVAYRRVRRSGATGCSAMRVEPHQDSGLVRRAVSCRSSSTAVSGVAAITSSSAARLVVIPPWRGERPGTAALAGGGLGQQPAAWGGGVEGPPQRPGPGSPLGEPADGHDEVRGGHPAVPAATPAARAARPGRGIRSVDLARQGRFRLRAPDGRPRQTGAELPVVANGQGVARLRSTRAADKFSRASGPRSCELSGGPARARGRRERARRTWRPFEVKSNLAASSRGLSRLRLRARR